MNSIKITTVKGHCTTWTIEETEKGFLIKPNRPDKPIYYPTLGQAKWAIRHAESEFIKRNPDFPLANPDIWCCHGVLWVEDFDGNYND